MVDRNRDEGTEKSDGDEDRESWHSFACMRAALGTLRRHASCDELAVVDDETKLGLSPRRLDIENFPSALEVRLRDVETDTTNGIRQERIRTYEMLVREIAVDPFLDEERAHEMRIGQRWITREELEGMHQGHCR